MGLMLVVLLASAQIGTPPSSGRSGPRGNRLIMKPPIPRVFSMLSNGHRDLNSADADADTASVAESDDVSFTTEDDFATATEEESVQVWQPWTSFQTRLT